LTQPIIILLVIFLLFAITIILWIINKKIFMLIIGIILFLFILFILNFFRDPDRQIPDEKNIIISPADGKVVEIKSDQELLFFDKKFVKVSIYLSLWDVHINRIPIDGEIIFQEYSKGKFYPAYKNKASQKNESNLIGIKTKIGEVFVKQIAGIIARRIISTVNIGDEVYKGQRFGMIRFGSRVELFLPNDIELTITKGDVLRGGESIVGKFYEK